MNELEKAKQLILKHLEEIITVKNTKWVYDEEAEEYKEVDAGYSEKSIESIKRGLKQKPKEK